MHSSDDNARESSPRRLDSFRLIPVIEFEPWDFSKRVSTASRRDDPLEWQAYWKASMADSGLFEIEPHTPGSWFVRVESIIAPTTLAALLEAHLSEYDPRSIREIEEAIAAARANTIDMVRDYVSPFSGGCVLVENGETLLEPGCCCDLGNLAEWEAAVRGENTAWSSLWIGHPFPNARLIEERLELTAALEPEITTKSARWSLDRARVIDELARARITLDALADRLRGPVRDRLGASDEIARTLSMHLIGRGTTETA